jgi:hypothetical protein
MPGKHPGRLHHLADRIKDPLGPLRGADAVAPVHQHRGMEPLVIQPQPAAIFQAMSRRSELAASRSLKPSSACSTRTLATTSAGTDGWPRP